ncbi:MAG TPA: tripartite tricarboxylate transporter TctB family protein [Devosia sp.]|nr:tripartite tricarboxylate transporter TctB family protein [Devosia sp.]
MTLEQNIAPDPAAMAANNRLGVTLQRAVSVVLIALGGYVVIQALAMSYYTPVGPGPGFFPFWLGLILIGLSAASLVASVVSKLPEVFEDAIIPERAAGLQMAINFAMVGFFGLTVVPLGFVLSMVTVLLVLLLVNRVHLLMALAVALGGGLGASYAFANWLHVYLPPAPYGALSAIGL